MKPKLWPIGPANSGDVSFNGKITLLRCNVCTICDVCICIEARVHVILIEHTCNMKMHVSFWHKLFAFLQDFDSNNIDDGGSVASGPDPNAWPGRGTVCCL